MIDIQPMDKEISKKIGILVVKISAKTGELRRQFRLVAFIAKGISNKRNFEIWKLKREIDTIKNRL
jgi:hypothetical protein